VETVYEKQPMALQRIPNEIQAFTVAVTTLKDRIAKLPTEDIARIQIILLPHIYTPDILFDELIQREGRNMANDLSEKNLSKLVETIIQRIDQHQVTFGHLKYSFSPIHAQFMPMTEEYTLQLLFKIINEGVISHGLPGANVEQETQFKVPLAEECVMPPKKMPAYVIERIMAKEIVAKRMFSDYEQAEQICRDVCSVI
jgi:hypothetical protein